MPNWRRKFSRVGAVALAVGVLGTSSAVASETSTCRLVAPAEVRLHVGDKADFTLALIPDDGYAVSTTGPLRVSLTPESGSGLDVRRSEMRRSQATDPASPAPRFIASLQAARAERSVVAVKAWFWLCRAALCRPAVRELAVVVVVEEPVTASPDEPAPPTHAE